MVEYGEGEEVVVVMRVNYNSNLEIESCFPGTRGSPIFPYTPRVPQKESAFIYSQNVIHVRPAPALVYSKKMSVLAPLPDEDDGSNSADDTVVDLASPSSSSSAQQKSNDDVDDSREEEEGEKNRVLLDAISDDTTSSIHVPLYTYIFYAYDKIIYFSARVVRTWELDSRLIGKNTEVPTERARRRGAACLGALISMILCGFMFYRVSLNGGPIAERMYGSFESESTSGSSGWLDQAKAFLSNATGVEAILGTTDNEQMFPTILEEIHEDASACDARIRAAQVPYFYNRHCAYLGRLSSANAGEERRDALFEHLARDLESRFARNYITFLADTNVYRLRGMGKSDWGVDEDAEEKLGMFPSLIREALEEDEEKKALGILAEDSVEEKIEEAVVETLANSEEKSNDADEEVESIAQEGEKRRSRRLLLGKSSKRTRSRMSKHSAHLRDLVRIGNNNHLVVLAIGAKEAPFALAAARAFRKNAVPGVARIFEGSPEQFFALEQMKLALPNAKDAKRLRLVSSFVGKTRKTKQVSKKEVFGSIGEADWGRTLYFGSALDEERRRKGTKIELLQLSPREAMVGGIPIILSAADELQSGVLDGLSATGALGDGMPSVIIMRAHALGFAPEFSQRFPYFVYAVAPGSQPDEEENKDEPESIELFRVDHLVWSKELANVAKQRRVLLVAFAKDRFEPFRKWANERGLFACGDCDSGTCAVTTRSQEDSKCAELESQKGMDQWAEELRQLVKMREVGF